MTHHGGVLVLAAVLAFPGPALGQQRNVQTKAAPTAAEAAAIAQEQRVLQTVVRGDAAAMNEAVGLPSLMVSWDGMSVWTADSTAAFLKACKTTSLTGSDFRSVPAGKDVVVLAYKAEDQQLCGGRPTPPAVYSLSVWQKKTGRWSLVAHSEAPAPTAPAGFEGVYQYLPPQKGLAVYNGRNFNFLFGPAAGSGAMTANAGTYEMVGDTAVATIMFSTNPANPPGSRFRFLTPRTLPGDTSTYTLIDAAGRPTGSGRVVRIQ